ncbi:MAG: hypothetical protein ABEJ87_01280 [Candidatus Nanohalobium sp.]
MKNILEAKFVLDPGAKKDIAEAVAELRNSDYRTENRFVSLNYMADTVKGLSDASAQVSVSGKHFSMPETDKITPEYRRAAEKLKRKGLKMNRSEKVDVDVQLPFSFWQEDLLVDARQALTDAGFEFEGFRLEGYGGSERSIEELYENFENQRQFVELLVAEPTEKGEPELEISTRYTEDHFEVEVYDWNYSGDLEPDQIRAYIERSLIDEDLPVKLGDPSDQGNQVASEFFYG